MENEPNEHQLFVASAFASLMQSVFPRTLSGCLEAIRKANVDQVKPPFSIPVKAALALLEKFKDDVHLRFYVTELATPEQAGLIYAACNYYFRVFMLMSPESDEFHREFGFLVAQMSALYMARRGLSMLAKGDADNSGGPELDAGDRLPP